jgi:ATP-independent RNA helicase DbpA
MPAKFDSLALTPSLLSVVAELGYEHMTPIQEQSLPLLLEGRDLIGQSKTGSGKTVAFAVPILQKLDLSRRSLQALVLCPTRELSAQVAREIRKLGRKHQGLSVLVVAGGESGRLQARALERGVQLVVGTPGRLLDHLGRGTIDFEGVATVVLDEADRMLDMGFQADIEKILAEIPQPRQTLFFSATFPASIAQMSKTHQTRAARVTIDSPTEALPDIRQLAVHAESEEKLRSLLWVLDQFPCETALVFCNLKSTVAEVTQQLAEAGVSVDCLHGDLDQFERDQVLAMFRNESLRVLVASDVAARGLDVVGLDLVVNYEVPSQPDTYLHRIGRTGRAGKTGQAISLTTLREQRRLTAVEQQLGIELERVASGASKRRVEPARRLREAKMTTLQIAGGRKDKLRAGDILGALTGEAGGLDAKQIGKIEIHDRLSYVAVARAHGKAAVRSLTEGRIKGRRLRTSLIERG